MRRSDDPRWLILWGFGLFLLLGLLGWQQYRWVGELSRADRERTVLGLEQATAAMAYDFDRLLSQVVLSLVPEPGARAIPGKVGAESNQRLVRRWQRLAPYPELLRGVFLGYGEGRERRWRTLDTTSGALTVTTLPDALQSVAELRAPPARSRRSSGRGPRNLVRRERQRLADTQVLMDEVPALVVPLRGERGRLLSREAFQPPDMLVLWLDQRVIEEVVLPELVRRHLAASTTPFRVAVVRQEAPNAVVFRSGLEAGEPVPFEHDASAPLFGLLPPGQVTERDLAGWLGTDDGRSRSSALPRSLVMGLYDLLAQSAAPRWTLLVSHPAGSVDSAVRQARARNLGVGLGVLGLLAVALTLLLLATRRMQAAARQQLDFVAGVTHELRTPVAAMRVAGQNLADGVVQAPEKVVRYGLLIEREGRRLTSMIEQVLAFAGIQSGQRQYRRETVQVADVVDAALEEMGLALDEAGMEVERTVAADLPSLQGDRTALVQAVRNLVENAAKYAASGGWLGVDARVEDAGANDAMVVIAVSDRGPGVPAESQKRIFEPFVRGTSPETATGHVGGSGLGLGLVRDIALGHGGRVTLSSTGGAGSTFSLHLPYSPTARRPAGGGSHE